MFYCMSTFFPDLYEVWSKNYRKILFCYYNYCNMSKAINILVAYNKNCLPT